MHVKLILPSLKEAGSAQWRPIKYALFPPLGLATLAAYIKIGIEHAPQRGRAYTPTWVQPGATK